MRESLKKFFEPALENKKFIFMLAFKSILRNLIEFWWIETARRCILAIEQKNIEQLTLYAWVWIWISLLWTLWQFSLKQYGRFWTYVMLKSIYRKIYKKLIRVDPQIYEETWSGKVSWIISEWTVARTSTIDRIIDEWIMFIINFTVAIWYIYLLMWVNYAIGWTMIIILFVIYAWYFEKKYQQPRKERNNALQESNRHRQKVIMHKQDILINNKVEQEWIKQWDYYDKAIYRTKKMLFYITLQNIWLDVKNFINYWLYLFLWMQIIKWNISLSTLTTMLLISNNVFQQITVLTRIWQELSENQFKVKVMNNFLDNDIIIWYDEWKIVENIHWDIIFKDVSFCYSKWNLIFDNFNIQLQGNKKTALVGSSWAWKTTLIKLIAGYLHPKKWLILIDNQELPNKRNINTQNHISLSSYYHHIWYLSQEPSVFDGTIMDNLKYAISDSEVTNQSIEKAISLAQCQWIYELKDWLNTEIGEKWIRLSWWQRQRLAIAKIILKNPDIILLDEPTSALDSFSEEEVSKAMNNLFKWRTVIIIAHRLQTVKNADDIIVLGNKEDEVGTQILERWTHNQLVAKWWFYTKMLELQSGF